MFAFDFAFSQCEWTFTAHLPAKYGTNRHRSLNAGFCINGTIELQSVSVLIPESVSVSVNEPLEVAHLCTLYITVTAQ